MQPAATGRDRQRWIAAFSHWRVLVLLLCLGVLPIRPAQSQAPPTEWGIFTTQGSVPPEVAQGPTINLIRGDYPHLTVNSLPQHLIAWDAGFNLSAASHDLVDGIETTRELDLPVAILRVDLPSLAIDDKRNELKRVQDVVNAADNYQRQFILALELDWAPEWYVRQSRSTVMEATPANETADHALGLTGYITGPVRHSGRGAMIAASDTRYLELCKTFIADLHNAFRNHPRFLGWVLTPPSAPLCYPGLGRDGVSGFADYSQVTIDDFDPALDYWALMEAREGGLVRRDIFASGGAFQGTASPGQVLSDDPLEHLSFEPADPEAVLPDADVEPEQSAEPTDESVAPAPETEPEVSLDTDVESGLPGSLVVPHAEDTPDPDTLIGFRNTAPEPLPPARKNGHDDRPVWRKWSQFRVYELQLRFDILVQKLRSLDQQHPIFAMAWGTLAYRDHNGYEVLAAGLDPVWVARHPMVDGLVIPFALSSRTFDLPSGAGDADNLNCLRALSRLAQRYNKLSVVAVERHPSLPPRVVDIASLQQWCVASGVDPWWSANGFFTQRSYWSETDRAEIARGAPYKVLPFPQRRVPPPITILDSPLLCANAYADLSPRMARAPHLTDILTACGIDYEVIFPQEFPASGGPRPPLGRATYLISNDLLTSYDPYTVGFQTVIARMNDERAAQKLSPYPLRFLDEVRTNTWFINGYASRPLRDSFLHDLERIGIRGRHRNGPPCLAVFNDTYVFYRALRSGPGRAPELFLLDTDEAAVIQPLGTIDYINLKSDEVLSLKLTNGFVDFSLLPKSPGEGPVLLGRPNALGTSRLVYAQASLNVIHNQQAAAMRQSLPWILLLTLSAIALGLLFVYQLNVSRKGGLRLYLLRRQQAAVIAMLHGKSGVPTIGGANSVRRFQAAGPARDTSTPHKPLTSDLPPDPNQLDD